MSSDESKIITISTNPVIKVLVAEIAADIKATRTTPPSGYKESSGLSTWVKLILDQPNPVKGIVLSNNSTNTYDAAKEN